jgi:prepilin-type N-terminal cleavage/methylation domain-containing protein
MVLVMYLQPKRLKSVYGNTGFTLAELLIALAILGVIATFTIPKILTATGTAQIKAVAKETASSISAAYRNYSADRPVLATTGLATAGILSEVNYVSASTATAALTGLPQNCTAGTYSCILFHSGAILQYVDANQFGGTANTNYVVFNVDPDGTKGTSTGDIVTFMLLANGRITDISKAPAGATTGGTIAATDYVATTPAWYTWNQ